MRIRNKCCKTVFYGMKPALCLLFLILSVPNFSFTQVKVGELVKEASQLFDAGETTEACQRLQKLDAGQRAQLPLLQHANWFYYNGLCRHENQDWYGSIEDLHQALKLRGDAEPLYPHKTDILQDLARIYGKLGQTDKKLKYLQASLEICHEYLPANHEEIAGHWFEISSVYAANRDFEAERLFCLKALDFYLEQPQQYPARLGECYATLGLNAAEGGEYQKALSYHFKAVPYLEKAYSSESKRMSSVMQSIGWTLARSGDFAKGLPYLEKSLNIRRKVLGENDPLTASSYHILGYLHLYERNFAQAEINLRKALDLRKKLWTEVHPEIAQSYTKLSELYFTQGKYARSVVFCRQAEQTAWGRSLVPGENLKNDQSPRFPTVLINALIAKAISLEYLYAQESKNPQDLIEALQGLETAVVTMQNMQRGYQHHESAILLQQRFQHLFEMALRILKRLWEAPPTADWHEKAWTFMEQSKAFQMQLALGRKKALQAAGVPVSVRNELDSLEQHIAWQESEYYLAMSDKDSLKAQKMRSRFFDSRKRYEELDRNLEIQVPSYAQLKAPPPPVSLKNIQDSLRKYNEGLLAWFPGTYHSYSLSIKGDSLFLDKTNGNVNQQVDSICQLLRKPDFQGRKQIIHFRKLAFDLYQSLIPVALRDSFPLLIIPHGELYHLPIEVLLTHSPDAQSNWQSLPYLVKKRAIRYSYSGSLAFKRNEGPEKEKEFHFLGFAPSFSRSDSFSLAPLPYAKEEVRTLASDNRGTGFLDTDATLHQFRQQSKKARILHIASHSVLDSENDLNSGIVFTSTPNHPRVLTASEVSHARINAELVVLSGCETGLGTSQNGEGLASLARAFAWAGCPSTLLTLWKMEDKSSLKLMQLFYQFLGEGHSKSAALQNAQHRFLKESDPLSAHPFFWASTVIMGGNSPIPLPENPSLFWLWAIFSFSFAGSSWWLYTKFRRKLSS